MFKTIVLTALLFGLAVADLKNYTDMDALILARMFQDNRSQNAEPPRELYDEYHRALTLIREKVPHMAQIHAENDGYGKVICNINTIDLEKLNSSALGPISVDQITGGKHLITFKQPYSYLYLGYTLETKFVLASATQIPNCSGYIHVGSTSYIAVIGDFYNFIESSVDCFNECLVKHHYVFEVKGNNVTMHKEFIVDDRKNHGNSTTIKPDDIDE